ncbi:MAG: putative selenate reductase subunit YgfK [Bacillota bacterium]
MSDRMRVIPFANLLKWALAENAQEESIFGLPKAKFFRKRNQTNRELFGTALENPLGPAAGPHTQLAQNIVTAYLGGSRFFELKTVQIIDGEDLPVSKPCILAKDEGYNVEWSTELTVQDAFNEYVKAWFLLNILARELNLGSSNGFIFNMSVGYDLAGIESPKINSFIEGLKDASRTPAWQECRNYLLDNLSLFKNIDRRFIEGISPNLCSSITLSTLHGCPPAEIERIAEYLLAEKELHTFVKCNPTLLGYEFARNLLDKMGYDYLAFDEDHFRDDLQFSEAVPMIARLKGFARERGLTFGLKLSNTFPVKIKQNELPGEEMYMSGRALYPLTINLAYKLAQEFQGNLKISYSGGADFFNIAQIYQTGIWPITVATTILKPGGYSRLKQMADLLEETDSGPVTESIDLTKLKLLAEKAATDPNYLKDSREVEDRLIPKSLPLIDCFVAPCAVGCPLGQDVPEYIRLAGEGRYLEALEVITAKNPLPFITGTMCNHKCTSKCRRIDYEEAVGIRAAKLVAARNGFPDLIKRLQPPAVNSNVKVAVIGAGPAGLAAGYFLGQNGVEATIFERKPEIGGIIQHVAPDFRISREAIDNDLELVRRSGVCFRLGVAEDFSIESLKKEGFKYIFIAIGAWKSISLKLESSDREILNALEFLEVYKKHRETLNIGKRVAVIGAGNSAMDAARSAIRMPGLEKVYLIYRRTKKYMPAAREELRLALEDGVEFKELLSPVSFNQGVLRCQQMELGAFDATGRRVPVAVSGEFTDFQVDSLIAAVGERVDTGILARNGIELNENGGIKVNQATNETNLLNVYIGGDALKGPATIAEAIADGAKFAAAVIAKEKKETFKSPGTPSFDQAKQLAGINRKKGVLRNFENPEKENQRCLECNSYCNICVEVCPNRANFAVRVMTDQLKCRNQIIHLDGNCNECGNCETFCPYEGAPYRDKFTLFRNMEDFTDSQNAGFVLADEETNRFRVRLGKNLYEIIFDLSGNCNRSLFPNELTDIIWSVYQDYRYLLI